MANQQSTPCRIWRGTSREIRSSTESAPELARRLGINRSTTFRARRGDTYKDVK